jgi:hypothetical protein
MLVKPRWLSVAITTTASSLHERQISKPELVNPSPEWYAPVTIKGGSDG